VFLFPLETSNDSRTSRGFRNKEQIGTRSGGCLGN